jgi:hypothetical protein
MIKAKRFQSLQFIILCAIIISLGYYLDHIHLGNLTYSF